MHAHDTTAPTRLHDLEIEARESIRTIQCALTDLAATVEAIRQLRHATDAPSGLVVEHGPNGRPAVNRKALDDEEIADAVSRALASARILNGPLPMSRATTADTRRVLVEALAFIAGMPISDLAAAAREVTR